ncbi:MFS transporter [Dactylosporangium darangshiense]|uniref:MFS transporter n=1 Tax=Dactylosporangium darangshiense TaxID=579108 RepID=UPI00362BDDDC
MKVLRRVAGDHTLISMIILAGLASFFVGTSLQATMPSFADDLGADATDIYGVLLFATGAGGVVGGLLLEATGRIRPTVRAALVTTLLYGVTSLLFAVTDNYPVAIVVLFIGGVANLASMSIGQTVTQLLAPPAERGRVIGVYNVSANGLRAGSGVTVGLLGQAIGVHWSLALSSAALCVGTSAAALYTRSDRTATPAQPAAMESDGSDMSATP